MPVIWGTSPVHPRRHVAHMARTSAVLMAALAFLAGFLYGVTAGAVLNRPERGRVATTQEGR